MRDEDLREGEPGHRAGRAGDQLLQQEHTAEAAEDLHRGVAGRLEDARGLERRRRILELDRPRRRDLLRDPREQRRLHREPGDRRIVLDDDRQIHRVGERLVVRDDGVGVELRHARRADHHRRGAEILRLPRIADAGARAFGRRAGDDRHAAGGLLDDDLEHLRALVLFEPRDLAGDAERGEPVGPLVDEEVDDAPLAGLVDLAGVSECRRDDGIDALRMP